uniref:K Homology domain-containing protein n=1 Tax=Aegilops tauschii subsp. strangulata TaxID=200361 RepID=A0A453TEF2_AEGTS
MRSPVNKDAQEESVTIAVADEHMGAVIGRGGRIINEISKVSGAWIDISGKGEFIPGTRDRAAAKTVVKKKGQKSKNHPRNCVEKGLTKKQKVHSEEPAVVQYGLADGSAQSGNAMFQGLEAAPNLSKMGSQTPTYIPYMGTDFLNPMAMGTLNYEEMHRGASLGLTLLPSQDPGFVACHTSQASSDSQAL